MTVNINTIDTIDNQAPVIPRHSAVIASPVDTLWRLHTDVNAWPSWQKAIDQAHLDDAFEPGAAFTWETYNLTIVSTVYQVEPQRHTLWGGPSDGIRGIHAWTFTPVVGGVRVDTEESWSGDPVTADAPGMQAALDASLTAWLDHLRVAAEF
jgi:Polyketide cyclase / dehydrase and lipid transport